ncbi:alpha/beta fold hydrolase [Streptomyces sp. NBS 14/10]|uniref:esterase/lipase family protein n=1 Tax=Streptomyces sp. NBS 14/10 TaxID=1945643 RepID=UPI000B7DBDB7|nr:alpha/beta fold hydrolase [Streptomyces sp. NBS 14/10]KAK1181230.1 alpha/beta fold hydrolase [Streptomyces sp. NBS 14/10]NUP45064.1 alpha/beta fold hydrolase [Streptomyces sp.]NUS84968.1 alpha/beta fold hydrolase [Streptomyces sp.]
MRLRTWAAGLTAALLTLVLLPLSARADSDPGPPLETPVAELAKGLHCDTDQTDTGKPTVLFIPGTVVKGEESFAWNYMAELKKSGYPACWVDYPGRGLRDMQESVEYVVYAARTIHERTGRKVDLIGHSQGGLLAAWALRFWPDLAAKVDDMVTLGAPFQGTTIASSCLPLTEITGCPAAILQLARDSNWSKALAAHGTPMPAGPSYTVVYSLADEAVLADGPPVLPGTRNIGVQDICPGRLWPSHFALVVDLVSYELAADAIEHPGAADPGRINRADCATLLMPLNLEEAVKTLPGLLSLPFDVAIHSRPWAAAEPPLRPYAQ